MKIVINTVKGWFQLSSKAQHMLESMHGEESSFYESDHRQRADPRLVAVVEKLGDRAGTEPMCRLRVVTVPDGIDWTILSDDGKEVVVDRKHLWDGGDR